MLDVPPHHCIPGVTRHHRPQAWSQSLCGKHLGWHGLEQHVPCPFGRRLWVFMGGVRYIVLHACMIGCTLSLIYQSMCHQSSSGFVFPMSLPMVKPFWTWCCTFRRTSETTWRSVLKCLTHRGGHMPPGFWRCHFPNVCRVQRTKVRSIGRNWLSWWTDTWSYSMGTGGTRGPKGSRTTVMCSVGAVGSDRRTWHSLHPQHSLSWPCFQDPRFRLWAVGWSVRRRPSGTCQPLNWWEPKSHIIYHKIISYHITYHITHDHCLWPGCKWQMDDW